MSRFILSGHNIDPGLTDIFTRNAGAEDIFIAGIGNTFDNNGYIGGTPQTMIDLPPRQAGDLLICYCAAWTGASSMADNLGNYTLTRGFGGNYQAFYGRIATGDSNDNYRMPAQSAGESGIVRAQIIAIRSRSGVPTFGQQNGGKGSGGNFVMAARVVGSINTNILSIAIFSGWDKGGTLSAPPYTLTTPDGVTQIGDNIAYGYMQTIPSWWFAGWGWVYQPGLATTTSEVEIVHSPNYGIKTYNTAWPNFHSV